MSTWFCIISSLKKKCEKDVVPFSKVMARVLFRPPDVRVVHTQSINKNLSLKSIDEIQNFSSKKKPLAVILAWLLARETNIEKYQKLYLSRGFDVLTVNMVPKDVIFPVSGSQVIAKDVLNYLISPKNYEGIFVHAFSGGCYLMGEIFVEMQKEEEKYKDITSCIRGIIFDSYVYSKDIPKGISHAIGKNPISIKVIEWYTTIHLTVMFNITTKHILAAEKNIFNTPLKCPALLFFSEADKIGTPAASRLIVDNWQTRGVDVEMKCWKDSQHVRHLYKYYDEYVAEIDKCLSKVNFFPPKL